MVKGLTVPGELLSDDSLLDGENNLHLFRRSQVPVPGGTVYGVYHRCLTKTQTWTSEQVLSGEMETLSPLLKAEDGGSRIALAWQEKLGGVVQVRIFDQCTLVHSSAVNLPVENLWELESAALSEEPSKFCLLARKQYTSTNYVVQCAVIED